MSSSQVIVLDAGGQYCHLIARKVREAGISAEVRSSETPSAQVNGARAIIISGGPSSVYEPASPTVDPAIFNLPSTAVLGICYGHQLMAHLAGGRVQKGSKGEYGLAHATVNPSVTLFEGLAPDQQVWMSHRDLVAETPPGFVTAAATPTCPIAAMADPVRRLYAVQFHPEVVHTNHGREILDNFLFRVAGCVKDWNPTGQIEALEERIRTTVDGRNVFFFVSGGVDSTVAYTLCLRALGPERVWGTYVDTGLMRDGETEFVDGVFRSLGATHFHVEDARQRFLGALTGVVEPEEKRHIIGQLFVDVQDGILNSGHFLDGLWILGQGTIYPDTIESGGTAKADLIKTHHNRVPGIQKLIDENRLIEPLASFYKDEVRQVGRELGLPGEFLDRHPFPGPGLAIRCLCSAIHAPLEKIDEGYVVPVRSVGVQGDSRSYRPILALPRMPDDDAATEIVNRVSRVNRVVGLVGSRAPIESLSVRRSSIDAVRLDRLRRADAIVRRISHDSGFDRQVWQFPVVLIPVGSGDAVPDSVVLRPIHSVDGMTAQAVRMDASILDPMVAGLLRVEGIDAVFYDLTHKPPATIEWE